MDRFCAVIAASGQIWHYFERYCRGEKTTLLCIDCEFYGILFYNSLRAMPLENTLDFEDVQKLNTIHKK